MYKGRVDCLGGCALILLDIEMPENTLECPFLEVDYETDEPCCYLKPNLSENCSGLFNEGCLIKKN